MATMTKDDLTDLVKGMVKELAGPELRDLIDAQLAKALAPMQSQTSDLIAKLIRPQDGAIKTRDKGLAFGRAVRAYASAKMNGSGFDGIVQTLKGWGDADIADAVADARTKALAASNATAGGFLVPEQYAAEVIELRRAKTVIRSLGPREVPMVTGTLNVPKITGGATGSYVGENANATKSQPTFGQITLTWKKLMVLVPFSNDLMRYSSPSADGVVRDDIIRSLAVTEDAAFLRSQGVGGEPKGLRYWAPAANVLAANTVSLANVSTDIGRLLLALKNNNVPMTRVAFIMSPRSEHYLLTVQNASGVFVFRDEMIQRRTVWGYPYVVTTSVPVNLTVGANADCSEIYCVDFDDMVIGDSQRLIIDISSEAAYHDGSNVVAAFSQDQTVIRAIAEHDFAARDANAIAVLTGVRWGV